MRRSLRLKAAHSIDGPRKVIDRLDLEYMELLEFYKYFENNYIGHITETRVLKLGLSREDVGQLAMYLRMS